MSEKRDIWQNRHYAVLKIYMNIVGIWPYQTTRNRYLSFVPTFIFATSIFIPQMLYLLTGSIDIDDIFECLPSIIITITSSCKLAVMIINNRKIKTCFKIMENDWLTVKSDIEKNLLQRHTEYGHYVITFYAFFLVTMSFFFSLKPVILTLLEDDTLNLTKSSMPGASKLPFRLEYNSEKLHQYIYPIMIHCYLAIFAHVFGIIAVDSLYYALVHHACGMFSIIGYVLENIGKDNDSISDFQPNLDKKDDVHYIKALNCLRRHLCIIQFVELIESTFTNVFLISVSLNMIMGSISGIQVIMNLSNAKDIAAPLSVYFAQLIHLFFLFWQAQFLLDYSIVPYESICRGKWYQTSQRCQKIFLLIMNRSALPCKITAGKIVTLSIENFGSVMKTSMSYFTVLRSFE